MWIMIVTFVLDVREMVIPSRAKRVVIAAILGSLGPNGVADMSRTGLCRGQDCRPFQARLAVGNTGTPRWPHRPSLNK